MRDEIMRELTDEEMKMVAGGASNGDYLVLPNGQINTNANSPYTPAADNGLSLPKKNGAYVPGSSPT